MSRHIIIESPDASERQVVRQRVVDGVDKTLEGYDGWTVLGEMPRAPKEDEEWDDELKALRVDGERRRQRKRLAGWDRRAVLDRLEDLEARFAALEKLVAAKRK